MCNSFQQNPCLFLYLDSSHRATSPVLRVQHQCPVSPTRDLFPLYTHGLRGSLLRIQRCQIPIHWICIACPWNRNAINITAQPQIHKEIYWVKLSMWSPPTLTGPAPWSLRSMAKVSDGGFDSSGWSLWWSTGWKFCYWRFPHVCGRHRIINPNSIPPSKHLPR